MLLVLPSSPILLLRERHTLNILKHNWRNTTQNNAELGELEYNMRETTLIFPPGVYTASVPHFHGYKFYGSLSQTARFN